MSLCTPTIFCPHCTFVAGGSSIWRCSKSCSLSWISWCAPIALFNYLTKTPLAMEHLAPLFQVLGLSGPILFFSCDFITWVTKLRRKKNRYSCLFEHLTPIWKILSINQLRRTRQFGVQFLSGFEDHNWFCSVVFLEINVIFREIWSLQTRIMCCFVFSWQKSFLRQIANFLRWCIKQHLETV